MEKYICYRLNLNARKKNRMKYEQIDNALFIENRARFCKELIPNSLAIFNSNDIMPTNADGTMPFRQNNDLFHLSGVDQEESILLIYPDASDQKHSEILFLKETNEHIAVWEGEKLNKDRAFEVSGIKAIYWLDEFEDILKKLIGEVSHVYLNTNAHLRAKIEVETRDARLESGFVKLIQLTNMSSALPLCIKFVL